MKIFLKSSYSQGLKFAMERAIELGYTFIKVDDKDWHSHIDSDLLFFVDKNFKEPLNDCDCTMIFHGHKAKRYFRIKENIDISLKDVERSTYTLHDFRDLAESRLRKIYSPLTSAYLYNKYVRK